MATRSSYSHYPCSAPLSFTTDGSSHYRAVFKCPIPFKYFPHPLLVSAPLTFNLSRHFLTWLVFVFSHHKSSLSKRSLSSVKVSLHFYSPKVPPISEDQGQNRLRACRQFNKLLKKTILPFSHNPLCGLHFCTVVIPINTGISVIKGSQVQTLGLLAGSPYLQKHGLIHLLQLSLTLQLPSTITLLFFIPNRLLCQVNYSNDLCSYNHYCGPP